MKKITLILFLLCTGALYSQTYYLTVWSNGNATVIPVADIQKLAFSNFSSVDGDKEINTVIKTFKLLQNYPNPFNPSTTIEYQIPEKGNVQIKIFNINGQLVKSFENTHAAQGAYTITWNGDNDSGQPVATGLYIYQVSFKSSLITKKMLFVK